MKYKKLILDILICVCIIVFGYSAYQIFDFQMEMRKIEKEQQEVEEIINSHVDESTSYEARFTAETYDELKAINDDYVCYLEFENQLLSLPIVQASDNDYYLRRSFKKKYSAQGTPFLDGRNLLSDTNLTFYGHYVYADASKMFTPLTKLKKQENYENNKILRLYFRDEIRTYVVAYVYEYDYSKTNYDYTVRNFASENELEEFFEYPKAHNYIDSGIEITYEDNFITFQTCVRNSSTKRLIVVAKQIIE